MMKEVIIPDGVSVELAGNKLAVSGQRGKIERQFQLSKNMKIEKTDNKLKVSSDSERRDDRAIVGTIAAHMANMIMGATKGFTYHLRAVSAHFPMIIKQEGGKVLIQNFLGERTARVAQVLDDVQVKIEGQEITVTGADLEKVSQTAANIELATRIVGYDKKVFQDGVFLTGRE